MKILVDSNVILDVLLMREDVLSDSYRVIKLCSDNKVEGYAAAHTVTTLFYILRKEFTQVERREMLFDLFTLLEIVSVNDEKIFSALFKFEFQDFEDCVQDECAAEVGADFIVTRNVKDFEGGKVPAVTPEDFLQIYGG